MEKKYLIGIMFLLVILMSSSLVYAGWFSDLFDKDKNLVGQAYPTKGSVKDQVKCVFKDSTKTEICSSDKGSCKGVGSCVVTVSGKKGEQVTWKSSCGGYAYTTMDGKNDYAEFKCTQDVKETVKCVFDDSTTEQSCYSEKGSCTGLGSCKVDVSGKKGEQVTWQSTCGGYTFTKMDGRNDYAKFKCGTDVKETVKCIFTDSTTEQSCYSEKGSCTGVDTCVVDDVSGKKGEQVTWQSTCGGYAYTTMDGQNDYAEFKCTQDVKETVKCVFDDSTTEQSCYSEKGSCTGVGSCAVYVSGKKGEQVTWKSSCGGYAYTTMDGQNDYAEFKCTQDVKETVKCVMWDTTSPQECYSEKGSCKGEVQVGDTDRAYASCLVDVSGKKGEQVTWKSTCGGYAYTTMDGQNDYADFECGTEVQETVKCVFAVSVTPTPQSCYSDKGSCTGVGNCEVNIIGKKGEQVTWKNPCSGYKVTYAYTTMDGQNEVADFSKFNCGIISK